MFKGLPDYFSKFNKEDKKFSFCIYRTIDGIIIELRNSKPSKHMDIHWIIPAAFMQEQNQLKYFCTKKGDSSAEPLLLLTNESISLY